jgi:hypothetical protein
MAGGASERAVHRPVQAFAAAARMGCRQGSDVGWRCRLAFAVIALPSLSGKMSNDEIYEFAVAECDMLAVLDLSPKSFARAAAMQVAELRLAAVKVWLPLCALREHPFADSSRSETAKSTTMFNQNSVWKYWGFHDLGRWRADFGVRLFVTIKKGSAPEFFMTIKRRRIRAFFTTIKAAGLKRMADASSTIEKRVSCYTAPPFIDAQCVPAGRIKKTGPDLGTPPPA